MGLDTFDKTSVTITGGHDIIFKDSQNGNVHNLCIGDNGQCMQNAKGPSVLTRNGGLTFQPGDSHTITWSTGGTYHVTCTIHPQMNLTVTVTG